MPTYSSSHPRRKWFLAFAHALPVTVVVLALLYYWFALADRYVVFLYDHDMGPLFLDTSAFSAVTRGRYWMTGLVAGGVVVLLYTGGVWLLSRLQVEYQPPPWWAVWLSSALPLGVGVPLITMTVNTPTLPLTDAVLCTLAAWASVGLALLPSQVIKLRLIEWLLLVLDGLAMAGLLLMVTSLEQVQRLWARGMTGAALIVVFGLIGTLVLFLIFTSIRRWRRLTVPTTGTLLAAGLVIAYLLLPLLHYVMGGENGGYHYISDRANFFASNWSLQLLVWMVVYAAAEALTRLRKYLAIHKRPYSSVDNQ